MLERTFRGEEMSLIEEHKEKILTIGKKLGNMYNYDINWQEQIIYNNLEKDLAFSTGFVAGYNNKENKNDNK